MLMLLLFCLLNWLNNLHPNYHIRFCNLLVIDPKWLTFYTLANDMK